MTPCAVETVGSVMRGGVGLASSGTGGKGKMPSSPRKIRRRVYMDGWVKPVMTSCDDSETGETGMPVQNSWHIIEGRLY